MSVNELAQLEGRLLVIFDGHCGMCNGTVRWLLRRDCNDRLRFAPSDSPKVAELMARNGFASDTAFGPSTVLVYRNPDSPTETLLIRSVAVLAILAELPQPWPTVARFLGYIPRPIRDLGYRLVARARYRIWRRLDRCPIPTPDEARRFL